MHNCTKDCVYFPQIWIRMSFIASFIYTYEEFVFVTEATAVQQNDCDTDNKEKN